MFLTWVELRGFEPLTSCMPFLEEPSGHVEVGRLPAGQSRCPVWLCPARSGAVCVRSHLISHWLNGPPRKVCGSFRTGSAAPSYE